MGFEFEKDFQRQMRIKGIDLINKKIANVVKPYENTEFYQYWLGIHLKPPSIVSCYTVKDTVDAYFKEDPEMYEIYKTLPENIGNQLKLIEEMTKYIDILKQNKIWPLLENDYQLLCKKIIDFDQFNQCVADASRIWKEKMADELLKNGNGNEQ